MLAVRHVGSRNLRQVGPSGTAYRSRTGDIVEAATAEDLAWLLSLHQRSCGCGSPSPNVSGPLLFEQMPDD